MGNSFAMLLISGAVLMTACLIFKEPLLYLFGASDVTYPYADQYISIYLCGTLFVMVSLGMNNFINAQGFGKTGMLTVLLGAVLNIILDPVLIFGLGMGVSGAALATILTQYLSAFLILRALARTEGCYGLQREKLHLDPVMTRSILGLGVPAGCQNAIFALANLFIQASINTFDTVVVSGNAAAANADPLVYDVMAAFYTACASFMSQNYGAGKRERVKRSYFISLGYSFGIGAVLGLSLVLFGQTFLSLFTTEPAVAEAGMQRLLVMGLSYPISAFMDCTIAASRGLGRTIVPTFIVIMGSCVFRVVWVYTVFAFFGTLLSLYLLFVCSWTVTAIAEVTYFAHTYKEQMRIYEKA